MCSSAGQPGRGGHRPLIRLFFGHHVASGRGSVTLVSYALTIFLSAFLLFEVQPLMGKHILPWFGGGAGVWTACMLFFQCALLAGYSYAHLISSRLGVGRQVTVHLALLGFSLLLLPITPDESWKLLSPEAPTRQILALLLITVGVPFGLLASTGPLLSRWFSRAVPGGAPYRLYALSNAGSLLALLTYPFVVEPFLTLRTQAWAWSAAYGAFVLSCGWCAWHFFGSGTRGSENLAPDHGAGEPPCATGARGASEQAPGKHLLLLWTALAATASVMLLATTQQVSQDLAVIPLLWVLPLALYLLSFILSFDHDWWYKRWLFVPLLALGALAVVFIMSEELRLSVWIQIAVYSLTLFAACMVCHGELVRLKPGAAYLTRYYLVIATGGALGGVTVAVLAPHVLMDYWEYHLGLLGSLVLAVLCIYRDRSARASRAAQTALQDESRKSRRRGKRKKRRSDKKRAAQPPARAAFGAWLGWGAAAMVLVAVAAGLILDIRRDLQRSIDISRNFFGVVHVLQVKEIRLMVHGRSVHGIQSRTSGRRTEPTTYYGWDSGIGIVLDEARRLKTAGANDGGMTLALASEAPATNSGLRIGVIGLGAGTIGALTRSGDDLTYYEIDPDVERLARKYFAFIDDAPAQVNVVLGDARLVLAHEADSGQHRNFDVLAIDAFNSDAVPMHLLTREAMNLYLSHLKPDGLLAFNVTNRYVNLATVVRGLALDTGRQAVRIASTKRARANTLPADWVVVSNNPAFVEADTVRVAATDWTRDEPPPLLWTDEFASLWPAVAAHADQAPGKWVAAPNNGQFVLDGARLFEESDRKHLRRLSRKLYHDTGGALAIAVVTTKAIPAVRGRRLSPGGYLKRLYRRYGFGDDSDTSGLMILVSEAHDTAFIQIPSEWPTALRGKVKTAIGEIMLGGITAGDFSQRLSTGIDAIDALMRRMSAS